MIMPILAVKDVDASVKFYSEKLDFQTSMTMDGPDGKTTWAIINLGAATIGLGTGETDNVGKGVSFMIYVPDETNIDEYYQTVKNRGIALESELKTEYWGDRLFTLKDPDGYELSLCKTVEQPDMDKIAASMRGEA